MVRACTWASRAALAHAEVVGAFERGAADAADLRGAVAAGERVVDFPGAVGAVEEGWGGFFRCVGHCRNPQGLKPPPWGRGYGAAEAAP